MIVRYLAAALSMVCLAAVTTQASAQARRADPDLTRAAILNDPQAPTAGNPKGDVTIVAYFDYNCPFCMKAEPALAQLVAADGNVRLVYKDWPILGPMSVYAAKLALAAQAQGKYFAVHDALLATGRKKADIDEIRKIAAKVGVDLDKVDADATARDAEIVTLLKRNDKQAKGMGFEGTPVYLIGPFLVTSALDLEGFQQVVKDVRARLKP